MRCEGATCGSEGPPPGPLLNAAHEETVDGDPHHPPLPIHSAPPASRHLLTCVGRCSQCPCIGPGTCSAIPPPTTYSNCHQPHHVRGLLPRCSYRTPALTHASQITTPTRSTNHVRGPLPPRSGVPTVHLPLHTRHYLSSRPLLHPPRAWGAARPRTPPASAPPRPLAGSPAARCGSQPWCRSPGGGGECANRAQEHREGHGEGCTGRMELDGVRCEPFPMH